jgi:hypothetical protein
MFEIVNDGPRIASTTYWRTDHAARGLFYLSWNAGAARLLVPAPQAAAITDMKTAEYVILTRGPWPAAQNRMSWELLFEDNSVNPFAIHLVPEMSDRAIPPDDYGRTVRLTIWTERGCALDLPGKIRAADALPCLKEWSTGSAA